MPMMHVLHVSDFKGSEPARVVVGCENLANKLDEDLRLLGYNVWMTYEEAPERSSEEVQRAMMFVAEAMNNE